MWSPKDVVNHPLYVVCCVSNPVRYKSRYELYRKFQAHIRQSGAILITVEAALGDREFALEEHAPAGSVTHSGLHKSFGPPHVPPAAAMPHSRLKQDYIKVRVRDNQELWLKENLLNIGAQHLPPDAKYVAFVDADVTFARPDFVSETLHALQHFDVVQMFSTAVDMSPTYEPLQMHRSFGYNLMHGDAIPTGKSYQGRANGVISWHPGFAWAWRTESLSKVGGLMDRAITGPADHHTAWALVGQVDKTIHGDASAAYKQYVHRWQDAAAQLKGNVGHIDGTILHHWHGRKVARGYETRWKVLIDSAYDPYTDVRPDINGVLQLCGNKPKLRDELRRYFRSRNEDGIDVPDNDHRLVGPKPGWP